MGIAKVCGIETEYGIVVSGAKDTNPTYASTVLINSYLAETSNRVPWDFVDESPHRDARGATREGSMPPEIETQLMNTVLTNGARYYVDHAHPEYSTPECLTARDLVIADRAGEIILERSMAAARSHLRPGEEIVVYKNNSDGKGNSYGCHENYLLDRQVPFSRIARQLTAHLVTRQIYTGAGKVGSEGPGGEGRDHYVRFQVSQRADFFEEVVGLETTLRRPIVNTRDEPHADHAKYRRLHVITGDANLCEVATFLKVGVTALILLMIEDDVMSAKEIQLLAPVRAIRDISCDPSLAQLVELDNGQRWTALEVQWELYNTARKYAQEMGLENLGPDHAGMEILERWEQVLIGLEQNPSKLARQLDWVGKLDLITAYCDRHGCDFDDQRVAALDLQYHDMRRSKSIFQRLDSERLCTDASVEQAVTQAPRNTRAYFRGECLKRFPGAISSVNWDSIVIDTGSGPLRRVPMLEPLRGTAAHVDTLFDGCTSAAELVRRLGDP